MYVKINININQVFESHPNYELFKKQAYGMSGMISFTLHGDINTAMCFINKLQVFLLYFEIDILFSFSHLLSVLVVIKV